MKNKQKYPRMSFRLDNKLFESIQNFCEKEEIRPSQLIRRALKKTYPELCK